MNKQSTVIIVAIIIAIGGIGYGLNQKSDADKSAKSAESALMEKNTAEEAMMKKDEEAKMMAKEKEAEAMKKTETQ